MTKEDLIKKYNLKEHIIYSDIKEQDVCTGYDREITYAETHRYHGLITISTIEDNCNIILYQVFGDGSERLFLKLITNSLKVFEEFMDNIVSQYINNL